MENKATEWIISGIELFAETRKLEVSSLCKKVGKSKSSFYNIWPNFEDSRGFDRYLKDVLDHHDSVLKAHYKSTRKAYLIYDFPEIIDVVIEMDAEKLPYIAFFAQLRSLPDKSPILQEYLDVLMEDGIQIIHDFWKAYNFPEDLVMEQHELRLVLDSFTHFRKEELIKDYNEIVNARLKRRETKDQNNKD